MRSWTQLMKPANLRIVALAAFAILAAGFPSAQAGVGSFFQKVGSGTKTVVVKIGEGAKDVAFAPVHLVQRVF